MAKEILAIPEQHLADVVLIIRRGLEIERSIHPDCREALEEWCEGEEAYLRRIGEHDDA